MENPLNLLMNPKSIATIGAGNNIMKMGTLHALSIVKTGYNGKFYPIHPTDKSVLGHKAYPSVFDLPEAPDLVIFIIPSEHIFQMFEDIGKIGTKRAIVITAGFKEIGNDGIKKEKQLNEIASKYGIRFVGPNCVGMINSQISLNTTVMAVENMPGILGMISQSGTYVAQVIGNIRKRGILYSKAISLGNEANIDIVDALEYMGEDEQTKAISLYIEGIRDGRRFIEVAQKITPHKPIIAQYVGGSNAGARAGASHTGAMAGPDSLYEGIFKQAGVIRVDSIEELYDYGWALATQPSIKGKRIGIITNSGGPSTSMSNTCDVGGLEVPTLSNKLQEKIREILPSHASSANPIDLTFHMDLEALCSTLPELLLKSDEIDGVLIHGIIGNGMIKLIYPSIKEMLNNIPIEALLDSYKVDLSNTVSLSNRYDKPLLISSFFDNDDNCTTTFHDNNIPVFHTPEKAARAMISLYKHFKVKNREKIISPILPDVNNDAQLIIQNAIKNGQRALDEHESKEVLKAYGIPVTKEEVVLSEEDALSFANSSGFPVVLKGCSSEILHKSGKGLIYLNLNSEEEIRRCFNSIRESAEEDTPVLVQEMVPGNREILMGMTRFPGFGPCLLFGLGGVFTESINDVTFRSAPLSLTEAEEMIFDIKSKDILKEYRGMPHVNIHILKDIVQRIGFISVIHPEILEIDLNPIIINGSEPVVVDALFVLA